MPMNSKFELKIGVPIIANFKFVSTRMDFVYILFIFDLSEFPDIFPTVALLSVLFICTMYWSLTVSVPNVTVGNFLFDLNFTIDRILSSMFVGKSSIPSYSFPNSSFIIISVLSKLFEDLKSLL